MEMAYILLCAHCCLFDCDLVRGWADWPHWVLTKLSIDVVFYTLVQGKLLGNVKDWTSLSVKNERVRDIELLRTALFIFGHAR